MFDDLIAILDQTEAVYGCLLEHTRKERAALIASDRETLERLNDEKKTLAVRAQRLEKARIEAVARLEASLPGVEPTVNALAAAAETLDGAQAERLRTSGARLKATASRLQAANRAGTELLTHGLQVVRSSLQLLGINTRPATYARSGHTEPTGSGRIFSAQA
jgi:flagellar biosynthesis/type III secretory pathway chaperone